MAPAPRRVDGSHSGMGQLVLSTEAMYLADIDTWCMDAFLRPLRSDSRDLSGRPAAVPRRARTSDPPGSRARVGRRGGRRRPARLGDPAPGTGRGGRGGGDARTAAGRSGGRPHAAAPAGDRGLADRGLSRHRAGRRRIPLQGRGVAGDPAGDRGGGARRDGPRPLRADRHREGDPPAHARRSSGAQLARAGDPRSRRRRPDRAADRSPTAPEHSDREDPSAPSLRWATSVLRAGRRTARPNTPWKA